MAEIDTKAFIAGFNASADKIQVLNVLTTPLYWKKGDEVLAHMAGELRQVWVPWDNLLKEANDMQSLMPSLKTIVYTDGDFDVLVVVDTKQVDLIYRPLAKGKYLSHWVGMVYQGRTFLAPVPFDWVDSQLFGNDGEEEVE